MECDLGDVTVYYEIIGEGYPLVTIHGFVPDHRLMKGCLEPIFQKRKGYKLIYFDLPGMGKTKSVDWIENSDQMLDIVLRFIDKVVPKEHMLIIGESYGGYLARGVLYKLFNRVDGLCLLCPVISPLPNKRNVPEKVTLLEDPELMFTLNDFDAKEFENIAVVQNKKVWERFRDEFLSGVKVANEAFLNKIWLHGYPLSFDVDKLHNKFEKPTLFLVGRQDHIVGYKNSWQILENYPRATFIVMDQAGHNLQIEQEELFNKLIEEWLDRVELSLKKENGKNRII